MDAPAVEIAGRTLTFPIEVRRAESYAAQWFVPAARAQALVEPSGLRVAEPVPRRAVLNLIFVRYSDTDLDAYNEVGMAFLVHLHDRERHRRDVVTGKIGVYIHRLPVNQSFTLEAGRSIWGYPKTLADISVDGPRCEMRTEGVLSLRMRVAQRGWFPMPARTLPTYTFLDGVLRRTEWEMPGVRVRGRLGGARVELGAGPMADELQLLGLPKRALSLQRIPEMRARFGPAQVVTLPPNQT